MRTPSKTTRSWPGAFHGTGEPECVINVGLSGPGVIKSALESVRGESFDVVAETIKKTAFKITRMGELVAREASRRLDVPFGIIDLSLAPTPAVGDSVARIFQEMGLEMVGAPGSTAALALLNDAVKKGGIMASSHVGGAVGGLHPGHRRTRGMVEAVRAGALTLEKLEAMTCVCSVGLDMIALPGDTPASTISGLIADEAAIGVTNHKTTGGPAHPRPREERGRLGGVRGTAGRRAHHGREPFSAAPGSSRAAGASPPPSIRSRTEGQPSTLSKASTALCPPNPKPLDSTRRGSVFAGRQRDIVEVALGVGLGEAQGGRQPAGAQRLDGRDGLDAPCGPEQVARRALGRADRHAVGRFPEGNAGWPWSRRRPPRGVPVPWALM